MQCTGVLVKSDDGGAGHMAHGRNMDIGLDVGNLTAQVTWMHGNQPVMTTTQFVGYTGVHTGMRLGGWTVQANERIVLTPGPEIGWEKASLLLTLGALAEGHLTIGLYLRDALLGAASYDDALPVLASTKLASPMYIIVGGVRAGEGAVITRDRAGIATEVSSDSDFRTVEYTTCSRAKA